MTRLILGDCLDVLRTLPDGSVHTCVTSPPYFGLRDYGTGRWEGGDPACDHVAPPTGGRTGSTLVGTKQRNGYSADGQYRDLCGKCGARRIDNQIGLEATPDAFVGRMVDVFREVRRCLRDDGTLWLNLGDSYAGNGPVSQKQTEADIRHAKVGNALAKCQRRIGTIDGLKPKDLVGIPWRVAFALQADGWYLRSDIVWHKPNPMPESVRDRPTKSHEYLFLMAKSERYYWDAEAVKEEGQGRPSRCKVDGKGVGIVGFETRGGFGASRDKEWHSRNIRSVWTIATRPYKGAHFATFPPRLVEPCIKAGTSERGCCPDCGKPWERVVERESVPTRPGREWKADSHDPDGQWIGRGLKTRQMPVVTDLGWRPTCDHGREPVPCTVLDPFMGSGTTGAVAAELGRDFVGIELNPAYMALAEARIAEAEPDHPLFAGAAS